MNKFLFFFSLVSLPMLSSCCWFKKCHEEERCDQVKACDLLFNFITTEVMTDQSNENYFKIGSGIINLWYTVDCPAGTETAKESKMRQSIYYSEDGLFTNPKLVDQQDFNTGEISPSANEKEKAYVHNDQVEFLKNGYYQVTRVCDFGNVVSERSENNNEIKSGGTSNQRTATETIKITNTTYEGNEFIKRH